jgi:LuxR family maltose regulon positive regulatory protein
MTAISAPLQFRFRIPPARPRALVRQALLDRLGESLEQGCRLILVSAPAGFGKTNLVSTWLNGLQTRPAYQCAWLTLEESDDDPAHFWSNFILAIQTVRPQAGSRSLGLLQSAPDIPLESILGLLLDDLAEGHGRLVLALDDFHFVQNPAILKGMAFWLEHQPEGVHTLIATRMDPFLPLARLRARQQAAELRLPDLRFSPEEARTFLSHSMQLELSAAQVEALEDRTEGWAAGLQMAALSLRNHPDPDGFIAAYNSQDRYLLDYFTDEILSSLPGALQEFLLKTSILEKMNSELCDALVGNSAPGINPEMIDSGRFSTQAGASSQATLEVLEKANLFLIPLDNRREWYRYHRLFADLLQNRLKRSRPKEEIQKLHAVASAWHTHSAMPDEAILHALKAQDWDLAGRLILAEGIGRILRGEAASVLGWCRSLPAEWIAVRPEQSILAGWAMAATARFNEVEPYLAPAEKVLRTDAALLAPGAPGRDLYGQLLAIRATCAQNRKDPAATVSNARQALEYLDQNNTVIRSILLLDLADASWQNGELAEALQTYDQAYTVAQAAHNYLIAINARCMSGRILAWQGRLHEAAALYRAIMDQAIATGMLALPVLGMAELGLAEIYYEWDDLEQAADCAASSLQRFKLWGHSDHIVTALLVQSRLAQARGDPAGALAVLESARQLFNQGSTNQIPGWILAAQARLQIQAGDLAGAARSLVSAGLLVEPEPGGGSFRLPEAIHPLLVNRYPVSALFFLASRNDPMAQAALELTRRLAEKSGFSGTLVRVAILEAALCQAQGQIQAALAAIEQALALAQPQGYRRAFLEEGLAILKLVKSWLQKPGADPQLKKFALEIETASQADAAKAVEGAARIAAGRESNLLSEREVEVLRLVAGGLSNDDIGRELVVSTNTIKTHLKRIYEKLGVTSRIEAVNAARNNKLL